MERIKKKVLENQLENELINENNIEQNSNIKNKTEKKNPSSVTQEKKGSFLNEPIKLKLHKNIKVKNTDTKNKNKKAPVSKSEIINNIILDICDIKPEDKMKDKHKDDKLKDNHKEVNRKKTFTEIWKEKSYKLKRYVTDVLITILSLSNISKKNIGTWIRAFHLNAPIYLLLSTLYASKWIAKLCLVIICGIILTFSILRGCWLSMLENHFCGDDVNIVDATIEAVYAEVNKRTRMIATIVVGGSYTVLLFAIYYFRFVYKK